MKSIAKSICLGVAYMATLFPLIASAGPSQSNSPGSASWATSLVSVVAVGNGLWESNGMLFNRFEVSGGECGGRLPELKTPSTQVGYAQMQGMRATLLTAISTGMTVKFHWVGPYCWVDDVVLCSDPNSCYAGMQ